MTHRHTHTDRHTNTQTHTQTHKHTNKHTDTHTNTQTHTHTLTPSMFALSAAENVTVPTPVDIDTETVVHKPFSVYQVGSCLLVSAFTLHRCICT